MKLFENPNKSDWSELLKRPTQTVEDIEIIVNQVFEDVSKNGDKAVEKYTSKFDGVTLQNTIVSQIEISDAVANIPEELKQAIQLAKSNIEKFHSAQKTDKVFVETMNGVECWQEKRPIQKVGLYIPGGTAPLFSTVLMLAVPAQIAGCKEIVLCSPPNKEGKIANEILYAAQLCGVTQIVKVGGIQAIAGLTFGTETIPQVYKIFGPGNQFVTVAKQLATKYGVAIDMPAGPSELLVMADESANTAFVASDLLSQAEHGKDSQVILVTTSRSFADLVSAEVEKQLEGLPRKDMAKIAISNSKSIVVDNFETALDLIDRYGPEHFIVATNDNDFFVENISNAGSVFIGNYTPESAGDYASGTNHTLPTNGFSKAYSGVNLDSFQKSMTFQKISKIGIQNIGTAIELMAEAEGLQAHKNAVSLRLKDLES
ncbi:histidinol dehydrogenase [Winogradskyella echinorum]|uniref:Histidinol dehydrogenase n=1 Tax=Winogradskyella echinorum TaxID=538189 RepID=A0ABR6Y0I6_9FLAO|nr:histidinol dehydrogenase [Winogradskyella echinorum]MBC3846251.1 histidinol dehydrogenase [Winogradskyella echinorum]MBC5750599.1 histidinol dehydrogenase [Winogradskyella echinorum]